jgi:hypothetical protein
MVVPRDRRAYLTNDPDRKTLFLLLLPNPPFSFYHCATIMVITIPISPSNDTGKSDQYDHTTPICVRVRDLTAFCQKYKPNISQKEIFTDCEVGKRQGYKLL